MHFEMYRSGLRRQWRWRLRAANSRIIANSGESYRNRLDCRHSIELVIAAGESTKVAYLPSAKVRP